MRAQRRRIFVRWDEYERLAVTDYEAVSDGGSDCLPVSAEVFMHHGSHWQTGIEPIVIVRSDRCGVMAAYRPGLRDDGSPFVQQVSRNDGERCPRGHRLCCPGEHECSLCVNDRAETTVAKDWREIDWASLADPDEQWRRVLRRAKEMWEEGRAEIERLEAAFNADGRSDFVRAELPTGADSDPGMKDTDGPDSEPDVDPMVGD